MILSRPVDRIQTTGSVLADKGAPMTQNMAHHPVIAPRAGPEADATPRCHLDPRQHRKVGLLQHATRGEEIESRSLPRHVASLPRVLRALAQRQWCPPTAPAIGGRVRVDATAPPCGMCISCHIVILFRPEEIPAGRKARAVGKRWRGQECWRLSGRWGSCTWQAQRAVWAAGEQDCSMMILFRARCVIPFAQLCRALEPQP